MTEMKEQKNASKNKSLGQGVFYRSDDYAGFSKRIIIYFVDVFAILGFCIFFTPTGLSFFYDEFDALMKANLLYAVPVVAFIYLVFIKRTNFGTLGYWLAGVKVVSLEGKRPSVFQMTLRFALLTLGPIHPLIDFIWLAGDKDRQTLRDKIEGTYIVRDWAVPIGQGDITLSKYNLLGFSFFFKEVKRPTI